MTISAFKFGSRINTSIKLPNTRRKSLDWKPQINDSFPDFTALTTKGELSFKKWSSRRWVVLVSHPAAFTPVCTSEIAALAKRHQEFEDRNVAVMALTGDPLERIQKWNHEIEKSYDVTVPFPHVSDSNGVISRGCGIQYHEPLLDGDYCARRTFLIDPSGTIRMIFDYPVSVGRSIDETLRVIDAIILSDKMEALTPSDWQLGDPLMLLHQDFHTGVPVSDESETVLKPKYFRSDFNLVEDQSVNKNTSKPLEWPKKKSSVFS